MYPSKINRPLMIILIANKFSILLQPIWTCNPTELSSLLNLSHTTNLNSITSFTDYSGSHPRKKFHWFFWRGVWPLYSKSRRIGGLLEATQGFGLYQLTLPTYKTYIRADNLPLHKWIWEPVLVFCRGINWVHIN